MGFNSRFTTKPGMAKSAVARPSVAKPLVNSVDECKVEEQTLLRSSARSRQSEAICADDGPVSSPKILRPGTEEMSVVVIGGILLLLFSAFPEALPLGVIGRSTFLLGTVL
jgi:hypothetical protein